jgi:hypothetical protein
MTPLPPQFEAALGSLHRLFEGDPDIGTEIGSLLRPRLGAEAERLEISRPGAARGEGRFPEPEELLEEIARVAGAEFRALRSLRARALASRITAQDFFLVEAVFPIRAELVVLTPLFGIAEDLVGLVNVLELRLGLLVVGIYVRMILAGELTIGRLDIGFGGVALDAENLVIVFKFHSNRLN